MLIKKYFQKDFFWKSTYQFKKSESRNICVTRLKGKSNFTQRKTNAAFVKPEIHSPSICKIKYNKKKNVRNAIPFCLFPLDVYRRSETEYKFENNATLIIPFYFDVYSRTLCEIHAGSAHNIHPSSLCLCQWTVFYFFISSNGWKQLTPLLCYALRNIKMGGSWQRFDPLMFGENWLRTEILENFISNINF